MMFWKERGDQREKEQKNGVPPCGQVRVLVVGDSGVGKTSLVHLIIKGSSISRTQQTVGCEVNVKHILYGTSGSSSSSISGDGGRDFFVELWDVSGHERYKDCRSLFYNQINGVIFVYDLSQRRTKASLQKWALEVATAGTFSAPLGSGGPGGLPVPYIVVANKADIGGDGTKGSSGNLVDAARHWVEKQGLLPSSEELPLTEAFPSSSTIVAAAKEARFDKEAMIKFFRLLIRRRYFPDELPKQHQLWSTAQVQKPVHRSGDSISDEDSIYNYPSSISNEAYRFKADVPPLPAQRNLTPPPTLYPQQPISLPENFSIPRFSSVGSIDVSGVKSKRADINV